ncbi:MAG: ATP-binding cassette domain-containing protein [Acetobacteraceae bacterium]|nr:ATP-binding cassette domain-containing protein [Acetobacteraceae bacterium]
MTGAPLLSVEDLEKWFPVRTAGLFARQARLRALDGVSLTVGRGEVVGVVGESGSGKTTLGRAVLRLLAPNAGRILFGGVDITNLSRRAMRPIRPRMQLVFQDPFASLNPRMTVRNIVGAPLVVHRRGDAAERAAAITEALELVGLPRGAAERYPHEFSGGQRQRIGIARALILRPDFLVADEPVSALDVSIQAQVVNLLLELQAHLGLAILFIAHDLAVVGHISDRIAVMYLGRIVEVGPTREVLARPQHPYTEALFAAAPVPDPRRRGQRALLAGDIPSPIDPPSGCAFRTRCRYAQPACAAGRPALREISPGHVTACIRDDLLLGPSPRGAPS